MTSIPLSKEGGLEPHLMSCPRCGGDFSGITVGVLREATLSNGQKAYYNSGSKAKMEKGLPAPLKVVSTRHVEEGERVKANEPCDKCMEEINHHADIVKNGGVYFKCLECGCDGVIKKSPFTDRVRAHTGIDVPNPVGVSFENCSEHALT